MTPAGSHVLRASAARAHALRPRGWLRYNSGAVLLSALLVIVQLIFLEGILSLDNVAVLAAMVSRLPAAASIPWPRPLLFLHRPMHRLLGGQRKAALKVGLLGAYLGRGLMLALVSVIISHPWLVILGGLYLVYLAADFLSEIPSGSAGQTSQTPVLSERPSRSFWRVVLAIELTDLAFSLDNVVAAIALSRQLAIVLVGLGLGILLMRLAAGVYEGLQRKYPVLETAAYLTVLAIGVEVLLEELFSMHFTDVQKFLVSVVVLGGSMLYTRSAVLQRGGHRLAGVRRVLRIVHRVLSFPVTLGLWLLAWLVTELRFIASSVASR